MRTRLRSVVISIFAAGAGVPCAIGAPDVVLCQLYDLTQWSSDGTVRGLAIGTTSWNIGTSDLAWFANPDPRHPFFAMNMYRKEHDRFEQIGTSWVRHGTFALASLQCDLPGLPNCVFEPGHSAGSYLGQGCTDTSASFVHAFDLGPRYEINPWTGGFDYATSLYSVGGAPTDEKRQLRVEDDDMNPALHPDAAFFMEARIVHADDASPLNSTAWKPVTPLRLGNGNYAFTHSGAGVLPSWGTALDAWDAAQVKIAEEFPLVKGDSPDGRSILAYKATDNGNGTWHYEYALLNVDMDRQIDSFSVPIPAGVSVSNLGFHAPAHTETRAWVGGPMIDNAQWTAGVTGGAVTWTTTTNPIRWGTLHNFRFDADAPPAETEAAIGLFRAISGRPDTLGAATQGPMGSRRSCPGDVDLSGGVDIDDLNAILAAFGAFVGVGSPVDLANGDGVIDIDDLNVVLGNWGASC